MTRLGTCAACGGDIMLVTFDDANGCRFCMGCGRAKADAVIRDAREDEDTTISVPFEIVDDDPTVVGPPDAMLLDIAKGHRP